MTNLGKCSAHPTRPAVARSKDNRTGKKTGYCRECFDLMTERGRMYMQTLRMSRAASPVLAGAKPVARKPYKGE